jgi:lipoyl(octanoyl) transferase
MCAAKMAALARAPATNNNATTTPNQYTPSPCRDALILLQHPPVYTLGAGATRDHLRFDPESPPLPLHRVERGGEVTYHGPGQLVLYPLLDLGRGEGGVAEGFDGAATTAAGENGEEKATTVRTAPSWPPRSRDLHWYLRSLEEVAIRALWRASGLKGERIDGLTGVWVDGAKLAAVGVRARSWCTYHGLALNIGADLEPFRQIVPCGISDRPVGSVRSALGLPSPPPLPASAAAAAAEACAALASAAGGEAGRLAAAAVAAARDPLVAEYRAALLEAFEEVFDARLTTGSSVSGMMMGGGGGGSWGEAAAAVAPKKEATARAGAA